MKLPHESMATDRMYADFGSVGVILIPKAASSSFKLACARKTFPVAAATVPLVAFVRDPIDRLQSAYRFYSTEQKHNFEATWPEFVDAVLAGHGNGHWLPSAYFIGDSGAAVYCFEDLGQHWPADVPAVHVNQSQPMDLPAYREQELRDHYRADYELRGVQ